MPTRGLINPELLTGIADAIRAKNGTSAGMTPAQMAEAVGGLVVTPDGIVTATGQMTTEQAAQTKHNIGADAVDSSEIVGMCATGATVDSENLFDTAELVASGKYIDRIENGKAVLSNNTSYSTYRIPVDGESIYKFTNCRTAVVTSDLENTAVGGLLSYTTEINSQNGVYILFSFNPSQYPILSYSITKPVPVYKIPYFWDIEQPVKSLYQKATSAISSGGQLGIAGKMSVKYGYKIAFKAFISAFDTLSMVFKNLNNAVTNTLKVTAESMTVAVGSTVTDTFNHGLSIQNDISIILDYKKTGVEITLESNGHKFSGTTTFERLTSAAVSPAVVSTGTVCTTATMEIVMTDAKKKIWYFGDSYISHTNPARWTYYLLQNGFDTDTLLNGYAGGTSAAGNISFNAILSYGKPKYAVFATGMNDGSDTSEAPSTTWANARNNFLSICQSNSITPIFCTIPTVPSVNNEQKNAWVKSSGYRYIDFAKAVGATSTGAWYSGMLSSDNVHPTEYGAVALFTQAITDFPEILE